MKHLRGTIVHRAFGDRIFDPKLWHWDRQGTATGLAIGAFFSALPIPLQSLPAAFVALLFRANVPAALVGCWITNPLTMPLFIYLQLKVGSILLGRPSLMAQLREHSVLELLKAAPAVFFVGGVVLGIVLAVIGYFGGLLGFDVVARGLRNTRRQRGRT